MLTTKIIDRRILIVLDPDTGVLKGAHEDKLTAVYDGDTQIAIKPDSGLPISNESLATALPSQGALVAQVQSLTDQLATMTADRDAQQAARTTADAAVTSLEQQITTAQARITELENPAPVVNGVPQRVTPYQARVALLRAGLLTIVDAKVKEADGEASLAWEYATTIERGSQFIAQLSAGLGLTSDQVDALFVAASQVT